MPTTNNNAMPKVRCHVLDVRQTFKEGREKTEKHNIPSLGHLCLKHLLIDYFLTELLSEVLVDVGNENRLELYYGLENCR